MPDLDSRGTGSLEKDIEAYQAINAVLRGSAAKEHLSYAINGREMQYRSISELKSLAAYFAKQIRYAQSGTILRNVE